MVPFVEPAIVKHLQVILDNKRDNVVFETFLEKDKSADTPVAVLERMNALEVMMERNDLLERMIRDGIIAGQQSGNLQISASTFSGAVVSRPPTSLGTRLYSPTANQSFRESLVPFFSVRCRRLMSVSDSGYIALSMTMSMHRKWFAVSTTSSTFTAPAPGKPTP